MYKPEQRLERFSYLNELVKKVEWTTKRFGHCKSLKNDSTLATSGQNRL